MEQSLGQYSTIKLDMKQHFTGEQIIGFQREAKAELPIKEPCRSTASPKLATTLGAASFGGMTPSAYDNGYRKQLN